MGKETGPGVGLHEEKLKEIPDGEKSICVSEEQTEEDCQTGDCNPDDGQIDVDCEEETNTDTNYKVQPECVKRRVKALRTLQAKIIDSDAKYNEMMFELRIKFEKIQKDMFEKRFKIISGEYEPTDKECDPYSFNDSQNFLKIEQNYPIYEENVKGIPGFWLNVFRNSSVLYEHFQEQDEDLLTHLQDIKLKLHDSPTGFTLEFHFSENEYFTNKVLTKYYEISFEPDKEYPFEYKGAEIINYKGCEIDWKEGKNLTLKTEEKSEDEDDIKSVEKTFLGDSFFNFFNPPPLPEDGSDPDQNVSELLEDDFYLGNFFKDRVIPKATLYFTGEEFDDGDEDYEEEEEEDEVEEEDEDKDEEEDEDKDEEDKDEEEDMDEEEDDYDGEE